MWYLIVWIPDLCLLTYSGCFSEYIFTLTRVSFVVFLCLLYHRTDADQERGGGGPKIKILILL